VADIEETVRTRSSSGIDVVLGGRIRASRIACGLSQTELGRRVGVSFQQVQKYERGANRISAAMLVHLAAALDVSATDLLQLADAARGGANPDMALDPHERDLLASFRRVSASGTRKAIVELIAEIART
jgi:transcriptional regulator with XRE-family HTH domain